MVVKLLAPPKVLCLGTPTSAVSHGLSSVLPGPELLVAPCVFLLLESSRICGRPRHPFYLESLLWLFIDLRNTIHKPSNQRSRNLGLSVRTHWCLMAHPEHHVGMEKSQLCVWIQCTVGCICSSDRCASQAIANTHLCPHFPVKKTELT